MADAVVTFLLENLPGRLVEEANFLSGVEDKVHLLIRELMLINIFLKNSQGKRNDEIVKGVVRQIRDVAHEAEDVIDSFISKVAEHRSMSTMKRIFRFTKHTLMLRNVEMKMVGIKEKINEIFNNIERYGIERGEVKEDEAMSRRRREVEEDDVVGFVHDSTTLVKQLTEEGDPKLDVISIIGMGGLGKTTLAKKIYNDPRVRTYFSYRVWVYVSQDFRARELLLKIFMQLGMELEGKKLEGKGEDELKRELFESLKGKRYIVVMDDLWRSQVWDAVRSAFPDDSNGSRILITSRNKEVALGASPTPPHELPPLNENESWELFSKKVFRGRTCPPELETLGRQIAEGCQGLPLLIVVLAGRLAKMDKSLHIWSKFVGDHVTSLLNHKEDKTICEKILSLSYTDLPEHLKPCFLYFGIYPKDFEIRVEELINLWVAEGFIQQTRHGCLEDDAEMYLEELIDRSLIQVAKRRIDGGVKTCRIHNLLRDLCITESAEEKFLEVHSDYHSSANDSHRLSIQIQGSLDRYMSSNPSFPTHARSLLIFPHTDHFYHGQWTWVEKNFKLLRVLDYENQQLPVLGYEPHFSVFPKSVATFIHLRYLRLDIVDAITDNIFNLTNLVTLWVQGYNRLGRYLSKGIFKLHQLRNLYLPYGWSLPWDSKGTLVKLQVLSVLGINYDPQQHSFFVVPEKFPNIRKLKIRINRESLTDRHEEVSFPSLYRLAHLETLRISNCGTFPGNPNSIPSTVTKLDLRSVERVDACVTELGKLRNLRILKLHVYEDPLSDGSIHVTANSFPQLQFLQLRKLKIEEWNQERSAMPSLTHLVILSCHQFTSAPELLSLTKLQHVKVKDSPRLARMLRNSPREVEFQLIID